MTLARLRENWRLLALALSALAVALASFAAGLAVRDVFAQPDDGVIYACKGVRSGSVRLVSGPGDCLRGEELVSWNQQGPAGVIDPQVTQTLVTLPVSGFVSEVFECPAGRQLVSGGVGFAQGALTDMGLLGSEPFSTTGWRYTVRHTGTSGFELVIRVSLLCAEIAS